jgi:argininosuccinate synthase
MDVKKIVLAYSGGLDTSVILKWLAEQYACPVIAYSADIGQEEDWDAVRAKGMATGAEKVIVSDLKKEFVEDYIFPAFRANAIYEGLLSARNLARQAADCPRTGAYRPGRGGRCGQPWGHRQGQRSGPF